MQRSTKSIKFPLGSQLPSFKLKNVDNTIADADTLKFERGLLVVFGCNHCPYVQGSLASLVALDQRFKAEGLITLMINSNDPDQYPEDSFENMSKMRLPFSYLFDETQEVAKKFDAQCTPECYLFNSARELVYHGGVNDSHKDAARVSKNYLERAITELLAGKPISEPENFSIGCSIKWKS